MKAVVTQGKAVATVEIARFGVSVANILCEALGYGAVELYAVVIMSVAPLSLHVQYSQGEGRRDHPVAYATITFEGEDPA